jgi:hypothetical protein
MRRRTSTRERVLRNARTPDRNDPVITAFGLMPVLCLLVFYLFVVRARLALGYWPVLDDPDPMALGFALHHGAIPVVLSFALLSPALMTMMVLVRWWLSTDLRGCREGISLFGAGYVLLWVLLIADPGSFLEWYFD